MGVKRPTYQLALKLDLPEPEGTAWVSQQEAALREEMARKDFDASADRPVWYDDYAELMRGGWPFRVAMYIAWASTPRKGRQPETLDELASQMGLESPRAIHTWRAKNPASRWR
jgi:hypothetical protein